MSLDPLLLDVLACPVDKGPLLWFEDEDVLYNPRLKKSYAVVDGVPVLLADEAVDVGDAEHERLIAKAEREKVRATGRPRVPRGDRRAVPRHARDVGGRRRPARAADRRTRDGARAPSGATPCLPARRCVPWPPSARARRRRPARRPPPWRHRTCACRSGSGDGATVPAFVDERTLVVRGVVRGGHRRRRARRRRPWPAGHGWWPSGATARWPPWPPTLGCRGAR